MLGANTIFAIKKITFSRIRENNNFRAIMHFCFIVCLLCNSSILLASSQRVQGSTNPNKYYFSFHSKVQYRKSLLHNPERLVLDFTTKRLMQVKHCHLPKINKHYLISAMRCAHQSDNKLRVVFVLKKPLSLDQVKINYINYPQSKVQVSFPDAKSFVVVAKKDSKHLQQPMLNKKHKTKKINIKQNKAKVISKHKVFSKTTAPGGSLQAQDLVVVVDPGHGGKDPGTTGVDNTHEKTVVLAISRRIKKIINNTPGFKAVLTRNGDYYLKLRQRLDIARKKHARMFVAIHADAFSNPHSHGVSVFALSLRGATSEAARWLAKNENQSEHLGNVALDNKSKTLRSVLLSLSQNATIMTSIRIGQQIIADIKPYAHLHQKHVEQAAFVVLKSPDIPSLLIEVGFLSNPYEEVRLKNPSYQQMIAASISRGIIQYFTKHPPQGTLLKVWQNHS